MTLFIRCLTACLLVCMLHGTLWAQYENDDLIDPRSSERRSGVDTPRTHFIPPTPKYEKTDLREFADYKGKHYSPYAQLQIPRRVKVGQQVLEAGYYLVKLEFTPPNPPPQQQQITPKKSPTEPVTQPAQALAPTSQGSTTTALKGKTNTNPELALAQSMNNSGTSVKQTQAKIAAAPAPLTYPERGGYPAGSQFPNKVSYPPEPEKKLKWYEKFNPQNWNITKKIKDARKPYPAIDPKTQTTQPTKDKDQPARVALLIKKLGSVEVIVPVTESKGRDKAEKHSVKAQLVVEAADINHPQIVYFTYCAKLTCYKSAPLNPGLVE